MAKTSACRASNRKGSQTWDTMGSRSCGEGLPSRAGVSAYSQVNIHHATGMVAKLRSHKSFLLTPSTSTLCASVAQIGLAKAPSSIVQALDPTTRVLPAFGCRCTTATSTHLDSGVPAGWLSLTAAVLRRATPTRRMQLCMQNWLWPGKSSFSKPRWITSTCCQKSSSSVLLRQEESKSGGILPHAAPCVSTRQRAARAKRSSRKPSRPR